MIESANLKNTAAKGLFWSALDRFGAQGIQFIFGIWLTRILDTSDYGLLGMILIFIAVGQTLIDSGFGSALIWKKNPSQTDYSTVFYFNVSVSFIIYIFFYLIAPRVASFYNEPKLIDLIRVISVSSVILSFSLIHQTILQKKVNFKLMAYVNSGGSILAGIVALFMAVRGYGVWSIVCQILIKSLFTTISLWIFSSWKPLMAFDFTVLKELFGYGSKLTAAGLIYTVFQNLYYNIIGKLFPIESLGLYTRASQLQEFPVKTGASIFNRVVFPVFTTIQHDKERLLNAIRKSMKSMIFVMFPVIFGLIAVADRLIVILFTEKWISSSLYFKLLLLTGVFYIFQVINGEVLKTTGKSGLVLKLEIVTKSIWILSIFITYRWGISAIIIGQIITSAIAWLITTYYISALVGYSLWKQLRDISGYLVISILMYLIVIIIARFISNPLISLVFSSIIGSLFYFAAAWLFKIDEMQEIKKIFSAPKV
jgi:teichuronic acid exporter